MVVFQNPPGQWNLMLHLHEDRQLFRFLLLPRCELTVLWSSAMPEWNLSMLLWATDICCAHVNLTSCWGESKGGLHDQSWQRNGTYMLGYKTLMKRTVDVRIALWFPWRCMQDPQESVLCCKFTSYFNIDSLWSQIIELCNLRFKRLAL